MRLFKYVRPERIDILENQRIAFTLPEDFNDVLDSRLKVKPMTSRNFLKRRAKEEEREVLKGLPAEFQALPRSERRKAARGFLKGSIKNLQENAEIIANKLQDELYENVSKKFCVLCLTTNPNDPLMWGYYADGHRGFMLEFNTNDPRFALSDKLHQIIYSASPPTYDQSVASHGWWKIKSKAWEHENEYRIISTLDDCEKKIVNGKTIYLRHLPRTCVKAVYMGLKIEESIKKTITDICKSSGIAVFESIFSKDGISYEFHEI